MTPQTPSPTALRLAFIAASIDVDPDVDRKLLDLQSSFADATVQPKAQLITDDIGLCLDHIRSTMEQDLIYCTSAGNFTGRLCLSVLNGNISGSTGETRELAESISFLAAVARHRPQKISRLANLFCKLSAFTGWKPMSFAESTALIHLEHVLMEARAFDLTTRIEDFKGNIREGNIGPSDINRHALLML